MSGDHGSRERSGQVQSVVRAMRLLRCVARTPEGASLKALSSATGLAPSTAHRLLTTLQSENFVHFVGRSNSWRIGAAQADTTHPLSMIGMAAD